MADITISVMDSLGISSTCINSDNKKQVAESIYPSGIILHVSNITSSQSLSDNIQIIYPSPSGSYHSATSYEIYESISISGQMESTIFSAHNIIDGFSLSETNETVIVSGVRAIPIDTIFVVDDPESVISSSTFNAPSGVFSFSDIAPDIVDITIISPPDASSYYEGTIVSFIGNVILAPSGNIENGLYRWYSSIDGFLGSGNNLDTNHLSVGNHTITLAPYSYRSAKQHFITILENHEPSRPENVSEL